MLLVCACQFCYSLIPFSSVTNPLRFAYWIVLLRELWEDAVEVKCPNFMDKRVTKSFIRANSFDNSKVNTSANNKIAPLSPCVQHSCLYLIIVLVGVFQSKYCTVIQSKNFILLACDDLLNCAVSTGMGVLLLYQPIFRGTI